MKGINARELDFQNQIMEIKKEKAYNVDARHFENCWQKGWVCYADLLAFADNCQKSRQSTINSLIRFHRAIQMAHKKAIENQETDNIDKERLYLFTDCCYFVSKSLEQTLCFALCLMNSCCAMNKITIEQKELSKAHHLLRPRIIIADGEYINASSICSNRDISLPETPSAFLAGSGIANAYGIEKQSFSHAITFNYSKGANKVRDLFEVGGDNSLVKSGIKNWLSEKQINAHFPWPYIKNIHKRNDKIHLVPTDKKTFLQIELNLFQTAERMQREFMCDTNISIDVAKHSMALRRFALELYKNAKGAKIITNHLVDDLEREFAKLDSSSKSFRGIPRCL